MVRDLYNKLFRKHPLCRKRVYGICNSKTKKRGRVLISYLSDYLDLPDGHPAYSVHSNRWESKEIVRIFNNLGFVADIINYRDFDFQPREKYDIFFDIYKNMERLSPVMDQTVKVFHATGSHWLFQNSAELKRLNNLRIRRNRVLVPRRIVEPTKGIEIADAVTYLGNGFTRSTYFHINDKLYPVSISSSLLNAEWKVKNFDACRNNFLWLGSSGLVHKGLDLVLEAFTNLPDYNLFVCGPVKREEDFVECYRKELYQTPNIETLDWVDVNSKKFLSVVEKCIGIIYPSCSEGGGGSVLTCMHLGLIPVVSVEASVEVEGCGMILKTDTVDGIQESILSLSGLPYEELCRMSQNAFRYIQEHHLREHFSATMKSALIKILDI